MMWYLLEWPRGGYSKYAFLRYLYIYYFVCCLVHRDSTDDLLLFQISSGVVWQTRDLHLSHNRLNPLSPRLCFFVELKYDLFVYRDDSLMC